MATINAGNPTLLDVAKRMDPSGRIPQIVELLSQRNAALEDMTMVEGNLPTGHRVVSRTALPAANTAWRRFNEGAITGKSKTDTVDEACGMLNVQSKVDVALAKLNGNEAAFRASEDAGFLQSLNNEVESGIFYHSTKTAPEKFMGLAPRFDSTTGPGGSQILLHDGSPSGSDQTSIWIAAWSPETVFGIYPKGSLGGLQSKDMGEQLVDDGSGAGRTFRAYVMDWMWQIGLCVKDYRYVVRIANIDTSALAATGSTLIVSMVKALEEKLYSKKVGRPVIYVNRKIATYLRLQAMASTTNSTLTLERVGGIPITMFDGIPIKTTDALLNNEDIIS